MTRTTLKYSLRPADKGDFSFVKRLYVETMEPLLTVFGAWDSTKNIESFQAYYQPSEATIVLVDGEAAGWFQIHEEEAEISLRQIHIEHRYRGGNIGTRIIKDLIRDAHRQGKKLTLSVVKNNPAIKLYERLGFSTLDEDDTKYHLGR